ncbi:hypothetical protein [Hoyosella altamirensis]|uniref:Uncharacterized protein n=1 Tax=Hoyosella altamirensis TaxID=616997 RepID=A0A839RSC6_9ACTN|nr:hypothetical protein [Hoyosella altamirensis]MBB3038984.1 hypothetical protein [Hoyosella altamirensis]
MIPDTTDSIAIFRSEKQPRFVKKVIAWSSEGEPLVFSDRAKYLIPATDVDGFFGIETSGEHPGLTVISAIPAPGWNIRWPAGTEGGQPVTSPLVGWGVMGDGSVLPLDTDSTGNVEAIDWRQDVHIFHDSEASQ